MFSRNPKVLTPEQMEEIRTKDFFDMILPGNIKFFSDHYIMGDFDRSVWVIREYPPSTQEQAILSQLADRNGVTLRIYHRLVESMEQRKILQNATRKNKLMSGGNNVNETIEAEGNLRDVIELLANLRKNKEPLLHCSVFIVLKEYLESREGEVLDMMITIFDDETIMRNHIRSQRAEAAIQSAVETYQDCDLSFSDAVQKLSAKFGLSEEDAEETVQKYWQ